eukprot:GEZU01039325.1.p1 GENE.GEZU01039325.1~~GEZU01039325.1.p1  ORF type:complete len:652 (-),score=133.05 GEZU01039325.1:81-2036(-)
MVFRFNRWISISAAALLMISAGTGYLFSSYAPGVKGVMGWTQQQLMMVSTIGTVGGLLGILSGWLYDKFGARPATLFGGVLMSSAYFLFWAATARKIPNVPYYVFGIFLAMQSIGSTACYTAALATNIKNFNIKHRGKIVGVLVAIYGLSSAIFTQVYHFAFSPNVIPFLFCLAVCLGVIPLFCAIFLNVVPRKDHAVVGIDSPNQKESEAVEGGAAATEDRSASTHTEAGTTAAGTGAAQSDEPVLRGYYGSVNHAVATKPKSLFATDYHRDDVYNEDSDDVDEADEDGIYGSPEYESMLSSSFASTGMSPNYSPKGAKRKKQAGSLYPTLLSYQHQPEQQQWGQHKQQKQDLAGYQQDNEDNERQALLAKAATTTPAPATTGSQTTPETATTIITTNNLHNGGVAWYQIIRKVDFWVMFAIYFCGAGSGLTVFNNLGTLVFSLGGTDGIKDYLVMTIAVANCMGRLLSGIISDKTSRWLARPWIIVSALVLMALSQVFLAFSNLAMLYAAVSMIGLIYGCILSVTPAMVSEYFGAKNFGTNWQLFSFSTALASYLLSTLLASSLYQRNIINNNDPDAKNECFGTGCYRSTFLILSGISTVGTLGAILLAFRLRSFYKQVQQVQLEQQLEREKQRQQQQKSQQKPTLQSV